MKFEQHVLIVVFWILFGISHSLLAAPAVKRKAEKLMGRWYKWYRPLYSLLSFVQTAFILVFVFSTGSVQLWDPGAAAQSLFICCAILGLVVMAIAIRKYFSRLSGIQVLYQKEEGPVLEQRGLHEYVRHPLYGGTLLLLWSVFFLFPMLSYLLTAICITVYTLVGITLEEKKLEDIFGQQYRAYKNNVPMIIPFIKFGRLSKPASDKLS